MVVQRWMDDRWVTVSEAFEYRPAADASLARFRADFPGERFKLAPANAVPAMTPR